MRKKERERNNKSESQMSRWLKGTNNGRHVSLKSVVESVRQCTHLTLSRHRHATGSHKTNPGRNTTRTRNANGQKRCAHKRALGSSMGESMAATYGGRFVFAFAWNSLSYQSWPTNGWQHITKIMEKSKNNGIV